MFRKISTNHKVQFFRNWLASPGTTGAVWPSSRQLAQQMLAELNLAPGEGIVELGPGTGAITRELLPHLSSPAQYLGIELSSQFLILLNAQFPDLKFVQGDARETHVLVEQHLSCPVKYVLSSLPFSNQTPATQQAIIESISRCLAPNGLFRTYQYALAYWLPRAVRFRELTSAILCHQSRSTILIRNLPPAFVLTWTNPAPSLGKAQNNGA